MKRARFTVAAIPAILVVASICLQSGISHASASASALDGKIVFQKNTLLANGTTDVQLFSIKQDGSDPRQLTASGANRTPVWSPSGRSIAFMHSDTTTVLQVMDAKNGSVHTVAPVPCGSSYLDRPSWSPDGSQLLFQNACGGPTLWVVNVDGSGLRALATFPTGAISSPSWSPDGSKVVFAFDPVVTGVHYFQIYTMDADGGDLTRLTNNKKASDYSPQFSPDGSRIVFEQNGRSGILGIVVMNADGSSPVLVSNFGRYSVLTPSWSPNGRWIVFSSTEPACDGCQAGTWDLFTIRTDGSGGIKRLTLLPPHTAALFPSWQPRFAPSVHLLGCHGRLPSLHCWA